MRIGIFGGSFNPPHMGHINSLQTVLKKAGLDKILVMPNARSPLKLQVEGPTPEQRVEMTKLALDTYGSHFQVDDREIRRGGMSYTIDSIRELKRENPNAEFVLILGADHVETFHQWKEYKKILEEVDLIFTSRPGFDIPQVSEEIPLFLKDMVLESDFNFLELTTGRNIQFLTLKDIEISSSELRKWLRSNRPVQKFLPLSVELYIKEKSLYRPIGDRIANYFDFAKFCGDSLFERKGIAVRGFDLTPISAPTEYAVVASGTSTRHASSLAEHVIRSVKDEYNILPQGVEGLDEGRWVVIDYGSLMVHVFYDFVRQEYSIEKLWKDGKDMGLVDKSLAK